MVLGCYVLWGVFPVYFKLLGAAGALEIIGHRIVWTVASCLVLIALTRHWSHVRAVVRRPRLLAALAVSAFLITINWSVYVYGVNTGRTADASLGYFINPLVTMVLAAVFLHERLRPAQGMAVGLAVTGVGVLVVVQGSLPWVSLVLALSFGFYGLAKKRVAGAVDALTGLAVETMMLTPLAVGYLGWLAAHGASVTHGAEVSVTLVVLLAGTGPVTAIPLLLFAAGTHRVPLSVVGLSQYISPILQFLLAWAVFGEEISPARWTAMAFVCLSVVVFVVDLLRQMRRRPRPRSASSH